MHIKNVFLRNVWDDSVAEVKREKTKINFAKKNQIMEQVRAEAEHLRASNLMQRKTKSLLCVKSWLSIENLLRWVACLIVVALPRFLDSEGYAAAADIFIELILIYK